jgi:hypothetical protein
MNTLKNIFLPAALAVLFIAGCDKPETVPSYLKIEPFVVNAQGGAAWQKITEGWVYVDGNLLGGFTLPATIPVLEDGEKKVEVFPGVKFNGQDDSPGAYLFMQRHTQMVNFTPTKTAVVSPSTAYDPSSYFVWAEQETTFDGTSSIQLENRDGDEGSTFLVNTDGGFEGKGIVMKVDTAHTLIEIATEGAQLDNSGGKNIWLELHYRTDIPFSFQLIGDNNDIFEEAVAIYLFNPTENNGWNKIYFDLRDYVVNLKKINYKLYFRVPLPRDVNGQYTTTSGTVNIDNIRLLSF